MIAIELNRPVNLIPSHVEWIESLYMARDGSYLRSVLRGWKKGGGTINLWTEFRGEKVIYFPDSPVGTYFALIDGLLPLNQGDTVYWVSSYRYL